MTERGAGGRPGELHVCSVASSWPAAVRLVETLRAAGEVQPITLLAMEPPPQLPPLPGTTVVALADLGLADREAEELRLVYDRSELEGALVPRLLRSLIAAGHERVIHLDCCTEVHGALDPLRAALDEHPAAVVPAASRSVPHDALAPADRRLLVEGSATCQVAVRADGIDVLTWWAERTRWDAVHDPAAGLFGAGRWLDAAIPALGLHVMRDPGVVGSAWTLGADDLDRRDGAWFLHGDPLTTINLRGFDPRRPDLLEPAAGPRPRLLLSDHPGLAALLADRAAALTRHADLDEPSDHPVWLDPRVRRMALTALRQATERGTPPPFDVTDGGASLVRWLNEPVALPGRPVTRLVHAVWSGRDDLRTVFREPLGADGAGLASWAASDPGFTSAYGEIHHPVAPERAPLAAPTPGLNIVGYLHAELGLGEAARLLTRAAALGGVPHVAVPFFETHSRQAVAVPAASEDAPFDTTLLCVNADLTPLASARTHGALDPDRHRIGYWFWEVDRFPQEHRDALRYVDELWAASEYVAGALRSLTDLPVSVIPHPVAEHPATHLTRADLGLSDRFTFAFWFDAFSSIDRKNPADVIRAFCLAFAPNDGPRLLIKSINGDHDRAAMEQLRWLARDRPDIALVDGYWSAVEMRALVQHVDCFVSLHRSEGFGQGLADAMMARTPVIATGHSGNLQYMTAANSRLVPAELVPVGTGNPPYPPDATWAAPDVGVAAQLMRDTVERPADTAALVERAAADIRRTNGLPVTAEHLTSTFLRLLDRGGRSRVSG